MIREDEDGGVRTSLLEQTSQSRVMPAVHRVHHRTKGAHITLGYSGHARRTVLHEVMAHGVDGLEEHHGQIPGLRPHGLESHALHAHGRRHQLAQRVDARIVRVRRQVGKELREVRASKGRATHALLRQRAAQFRRMHGPGHQRPRRRRLTGVALHQHVARDDAAYWFGGMTGVPTRALHTQAGLRGDVPDRLDLAAGAGGDAQATAVRLGLDKVEDAVHIRRARRGHAHPQERTELGFQSREVAAHTALNQALQHRHATLRQELIHNQPIGSIPTDDKDASS